MKKLYNTIATLIFTTILSVNCFAETHMITVASFTFTPNTLSVNVGDTIQWMWLDGTHNTTSLTVPPGATMWASPMDAGNTMFEYVITAPGPYVYVCTFHSATMGGTIDAIDNTGITSPELASGFNVYQSAPSIVNVAYTLGNSAKVKVSVYDITGKVAQVLLTSVQNAGTYTESYSLEALRKGIYLVELLAGDQKITKRMIID